MPPRDATLNPISSPLVVATASPTGIKAAQTGGTPLADGRIRYSGGTALPTAASDALDSYHAQALSIMGRTLDQAQSQVAADGGQFTAQIGLRKTDSGYSANLGTAMSNKYGSGSAITPLALKGVSPDAVSPAAAPKLALDAVSPSKGVQSMSKFLTGTDSGAGKRDAAAAREAEQEMQRKARLGSAYRPMPKWNPYTFSGNSLAAPAPTQSAQSTESKNNAAQRWEGDPAAFTSTKATHALLEPDNINARGSLSTQSDSTLDQQVGSALTAQYGKDLEPNAPVNITLGGKTVKIDRRNPVQSLRQFIYEAKQAGDNKAINDYSKFMGTLNLKS